MAVPLVNISANKHLWGEVVRGIARRGKEKGRREVYPADQMSIEEP
jgi:hypothetical protein